MADLDKFKSELVAERKSHSVALNEKDIKIWTLQKDQDEKRLALNGKDGDISSLKARLQIMQYDSEMAVAHQPFSAGVKNVDCNEMLSELRSELEDEKAEHSVTKAYYRQVDDAYNQEAEEVAELMKQIQEKAENKMAGDFLRITVDLLQVSHCHCEAQHMMTYDDNMSQSNITIADIPRVSRREADKVTVTVGPWPKI